MMRFQLIILVHILMSVCALSLADDYDIVAPDWFKSPEAAAFKRYGENSVNEYTGNAAISIPLYTLTYKDIEIPIHLDYDASGIKIDQEASWVGLGWNLLAGGCINYVSAGRYDSKNWSREAGDSIWLKNLTSGCYDYNRNEALDPEWMESVRNPFRFNYTIESFLNQQELRRDIAMGLGEQDYFSVNLLGKSFLFMYDMFTNSIIQIGKDSEKYKIECSVNDFSRLNIAQWTITDANGWQYVFYPGEESLDPSGGNVYTSAWYLYEVISSEGTLVTFEYSTPHFLHCRPVRIEQYDFVDTLGTPTGSTGYYPTPGYKSIYSYSIESEKVRYLKSIKTDNQMVSFFLGEREDYIGAACLDSITITSVLTGMTIRSFEFHYSYFDACTIGGNFLNDVFGTPEFDNSLSWRLKLDSFTEYVCGDSLTTKMEYNDAERLPLKTSCAKDFWGYYNGQENKSSPDPSTFHTHTLIPTPLPFLLSSSSSNKHMDFKAANRYCSKEHIQAAMLRKIIYPTQGYSVYQYEPHQFKPSSYYPVCYPSVDEYLANMKQLSLYNSNDYHGRSNDTIRITETSHGTLRTRFSGRLETLYFSNDTSFTISLYCLDNPSNHKHFKMSLTRGQSYKSQMDTLSLQRGLYRLVVPTPAPRQGPTPIYNIGADLSLMQSFNQNNPSTGGGLRIRSMRNYDYNDNLIDSIAYEYLDQEKKCSGKLMIPLTCLQNIHVVYIKQMTPTANASFPYNALRITTGSPNMPAFYTSLVGGTVCYSTVSKSYYDRVGKLEKRVETDYVNNWPGNFAQKIDYFDSFCNGNSQQVRVYEGNGHLRMNTDYIYEDTQTYLGCNMQIEDQYIFDTHIAREDENLGRYRVWRYPYILSWNRLKKTIEAIFDDSLQARTVVKDYQYSPRNHKPTRISEHLISEAESFITEYKYPFDFENMQNMSNGDCFMLNPVVEKSLFLEKNGTQTLQKRKRTYYEPFRNKCRNTSYKDTIYLPTKVSIFSNGAEMASKSERYLYDRRCDVKYAETDSLDKVTYLWGYRNQYPVAKIQGASYEEVSHWIGDAMVTKLAETASQDSISMLLENMRDVLASYPVLTSTYTYEPMKGMKSETLPNGSKKFYEYDQSGRLIYIRDNNGRIVQSFMYVYAQKAQPNFEVEY